MVTGSFQFILLQKSGFMHKNKVYHLYVFVNE